MALARTPIAALLAALLAPTAAASAPPEHAKLATSDGTPPGAGAVEVELSFAPSWNRPGRGGFERLGEGHSEPVAVALALGLGDHADVSLALAYTSAYDAAWDGDGDGAAGRPVRSSGLGDTVAGGRLRVLASERHALDLAVVVNVVVPTGRRGGADALELGQRFWSADAALVVSKDWGRLTANAEAGLLVPFGGARGDDRGAAFGNVAAGVQVLPWLQPEVELGYRYARATPAGGATQLLTVTAGAVAPFAGRYRLAAGVHHAAWGRRVGQFTGATVAFATAF